MKGSLKQDESGMVVVEAAVIFPVMLILILFLYFTSIYVYQKANLQSMLEVALAHSAYEYTDTGVTYDGAGTGSYAPTLENPYRHLSFSVDQDGTLTLAKRYTKAFSFYGVSTYQLKVTSKNYIIYRELQAVASQSIKPIINPSFLGLPAQWTLKARAACVVSDPDEFIRTSDIAFDIAYAVDQKFGISEAIGKVFSKAAEVIGRFF